ncbi:hypothetical protein GZL_07626 [Streptomyces sp. 769]|nr:hypothetical protein GZL_07626 [Streptomyces sp. 769]
MASAGAVRVVDAGASVEASSSRAGFGSGHAVNMVARGSAGGSAEMVAASMARSAASATVSRAARAMAAVSVTVVRGTAPMMSATHGATKTL